jgi:hypothetical protein
MIRPSSTFDRPARWALLASLALAAAVSAAEYPASLSPLPPLMPPAGMPSLSAQTCNACHGAIHDSWARSAHARAGRNPVWHAAADALGQPPLCLECHLPLTEQRADIAKGPGGVGRSERAPNPAWSPTLLDEGVTCAVCHVRDGEVLGTRDVAAGTVPHAVRRDPALSDAESCAFCHQAALPGAEATPFLDTVSEWRRSPQAAAGYTCITCHMPKATGVVGTSRWGAVADHGLAGADPARAFVLELAMRAPEVDRGDVLRVQASLTNLGAGHAMPTGDPSHRIEVRLTVVDRAGAPAEGFTPQSAWLFRAMEAQAPFVEVSDNRLQPGETRGFDFVFAPGKKIAPGLYTLTVSVRRWAASPEQAAAVRIDESLVVREVVSRSVRIRVD